MQQMEIPCLACNTKNTILIAEKPKMVNFETVSLIVLEHSGRTVCISCGATIVPIVNHVAGLGIAGGVSQPESRIVIPQNGPIGM